ncbi:hypothetical protein, conserved [Leishmania lindenbergi]|uniref:Transmembrane protein n=1 Tax=Leishmania lindenbergi TaxID=651832 RepID=A0AAW3AXU9_9TRYP
MGLMPRDLTAHRPSVGVLPYRTPPLSGLYRMRYIPPPEVGTLSDHPRSQCNSEEADDGVSGPIAACGPTTDLLARADTSSAAARHVEVHTQLLRASSLMTGDIDLFSLYSVCEVEPVPCKRCTLQTQTTLNTCSYRLRQSYALQKRDSDPLLHGLVKESETCEGVPARLETGTSPFIRSLQQGWYVFFFPISECGRLKGNLLVYVGDALIPGDVAEYNLDNDGCLIPLKTSATAAALPGTVRKPPGCTTTVPASKSNSKTQQRWKSLFYYVVSPVPVHWGTRESTDVHLTISWRSAPAVYPVHRPKKKHLTLLYSYYCSPRAPDIFTCKAQFPSDTRLRLVSSPNCDTKVQLRSDVTEHSAKVRVETMDGKPLEIHRHTRDYTFVLQFFFGSELGILEDTSIFAAAVVATVFLLLLWLLLTKDLVL